MQPTPATTHSTTTTAPTRSSTWPISCKCATSSRRARCRGPSCIGSSGAPSASLPMTNISHENTKTRKHSVVSFFRGFVAAITPLHIPLEAAVIAAAASLTLLAQQALPPGDRSDFTMALAGDSIITRPLAIYHEPEFMKLIELIRGADAAFTNLEMLFHDYESYPMNESGGTWMRADPALVKDLVWAGFDFVSRANNHAGDYGVGAMRLTTKYVREAALVQAG